MRLRASSSKRFEQQQFKNFEASRTPTLDRIATRMESNMSDTVAIVTGASQGIGRATAIRLARDFGAVVLAARSSEALVEVASAVREAGSEPLSLALDLSKVESAKQLVQQTLERFGRIDALLNIAGAVP